MSADIYISGDNFNYTHNLSRLWYDHIPDFGKGGGLREIDGLTGKAALHVLSGCFDRIWGAYLYSSKDEMRGRYDAPNGWGCTEGALLFLARAMAACAMNPRSKVRVSL